MAAAARSDRSFTGMGDMCNRQIRDEPVPIPRLGVMVLPHVCVCVCVYPCPCLCVDLFVFGPCHNIEAKGLELHHHL